MSYEFRGITMDDDIQESIDAYVNTGRPTGDFLRAVIENDLSEACARADEKRLPMIPAIVGYLYNECDSRCWGREGQFDKWIEFCRIARTNDCG